MTDDRRAAMVVLATVCAMIEEDAFEAEQLEADLVALLDRIDRARDRWEATAEMLPMAIAKLRAVDTEECGRRTED